jgi:O-antigen/teichoic acid export membrane protein
MATEPSPSSQPEFPASAPRDEAPDRDAASGLLLAIRNAFSLGGSLIFTWSIALGIRVILPRYLGPTLFGTINFADAFTSALFITLSLGADSYIRKEVAVRPEHATDFYGGTFVLRVLITIALFGIMSVVLTLGGRGADVRELVYLYGLTQFFVTANATLSAMLHAKGRVGGMSALSVATKIVWAGGVLWAMAAHASLWAYAASYLASESVETVILWWLVRRHLHVAFRIDLAATKKMLVTSLPYYLTGFATTGYGKLDVTVLDLRAGSNEVGFYGAASTVAGLTLLITPLIGWVLMPMFARAAARSRQELHQQVSRSLELILIVAIPVALIINLGADTWIHIIFGAKFAPAAAALRVLAAMFVVTYVAIIHAMTLIMLERPWTLTYVSLMGLVVNAVLNLLLVQFSVRVFGVGGGGTGCALAMLCTEIFVATLMAIATDGVAFTRGNLSVIGRCLGACLVVAVFHHLAARLGPGRLAIDGSIYAVIVIATGAVRPRHLAGAIREALRGSRRG